MRALALRLARSWQPATSSFSSFSHRPMRAAEAPVTWSRQIAPIVYRNCAMCHHPGGAGPFSLLS